MTISQGSIRIALVGLAVVFSAPQTFAQVLPRNKDRETTKQTTKTVERDAQDAKEGETQVETKRTRTRVRTDADADRTRSTTVTARQSGNILRSTQIVGGYVNVGSDQRVGKVTEIVFNDGGCISYLIVDMDGRLAPIPWQAGNYDYQQRVFLLTDFDQARVARIPTFTTYEQFSDDKFVTQVNTYFNVRGTGGPAGRADVNVRSGDVNVRTREGDARPDASSADRAKSTQTDVKEGTSDSKSRKSTDSSKKAEATDQKTDSQDKDKAPAPRQPSDSKDPERKSNTDKDQPSESPKG